jgi:hypothetical protein
MERFLASWPSSVNPVDVVKAFEPHFRVPDDDAMDAMQREMRQWRETRQRRHSGFGKTPKGILYVSSTQQSLD